MAPVAAAAAVGGETAAGGGMLARFGLGGGTGRGFMLGNLFGRKGGGDQTPKPSASEQISGVMNSLNPVQFG